MENHTHQDVKKWHEPLDLSYSHEWIPRTANSLQQVKVYMLIIIIGIILLALILPFVIGVEKTVKIKEVSEDGQTLGNFPITEAEVTKVVPEPKPTPTPFSKFVPTTEEEKAVVAYVEKFKATAIAEQEKFRIPASIKLAQGIVESKYGTSKLATQNNNHFGIKCFSRKCAKGHCSNYTDDSHKDFFRIYGSAWESWRAHSKFLSNSSRYNDCFKCDNYRDWAKCLKNKGYATLKTYAEVITNIIETYGLWEFDNFN